MFSKYIWREQSSLIVKLLKKTFFHLISVYEVNLKKKKHPNLLFLDI